MSEEQTLRAEDRVGVVKVLNPALYRALTLRFGQVKVSNEGLRRVFVYKRELFKKGLREEVIDRGEHYRICCPYCGDSRFRLYICYEWNTTTEDGRSAKSLACCHNEKCDLRSLDDEIKPYCADKVVLDLGHSLVYSPPEQLKEVTLPDNCVPLSSLPSSHRALSYLRGRDFDPVELERLWGLLYCKSHSNNLINNRIIVPIFWEKKLIGWQARSLEPHPIKYYTMPGLNKSSILFNGDRARDHKFGVVVEGVFDAFRVGPRAVAMLGKTINSRQRQLMISYWGNGAMCLMLDSDAIEDMERLQGAFSKTAFKHGHFIVRLPDGQDPASMNRESLWRLISYYAHAHHVPLTIS